MGSFYSLMRAFEYHISKLVFFYGILQSKHNSIFFFNVNTTRLRAQWYCDIVYRSKCTFFNMDSRHINKDCLYYFGIHLLNFKFEV